MPVKGGWRGRFFEDFEVGDVYEHPLGRTVTTTDNMWFTLLTQNTAPILHLHRRPGHRSKRERRVAERVRQPRLGRGETSGARV
jgi:hypothetical protein